MKAIIPAAGKGERWYPWSVCIPKEMLPIINKPIIHYVIDEAIDAGAKEIAIITRLIIPGCSVQIRMIIEIIIMRYKGRGWNG